MHDSPLPGKRSLLLHLGPSPSVPNGTNFRVTPTPQNLPKSVAIRMRGALRYKWEAYCDTHEGSGQYFPLGSKRKESIVVQMGGVLRYFYGLGGGF